MNYSIRSALALELTLACLIPMDLLAQDQVVLQQEGQSSKMVVPCQIVDYTGEKITVKIKSGGNQKTYPAEQVVEVRTSWLESHERGRRQLTDRRVDEAAKSFQEALVSEPRIWVRREILASLVRCALRQGDRVTAGTRFLMILESDRTTRHFGVIPLMWAPESVSSSAKSQARVWLTHELDSARLLGASFLLEDNQLGESAQQELAALQRSGDERVRQLAQAQSWRMKLRSLDVSDLELQRWDDRVQQMPTSLRAGPSYLLGRGWKMRREHDRAATALLWLPLMDDTDPRLTSRAGYEAAESLRRLGQTADARRVMQEIATRFPDTEFGEAASK
ncbi:MAG: tetratricopeptide repeat protein [Planctomycetia bacterium]|nr:tetratricopeptide repeat protein [Planctomycetia bacterium]